MGEEKRRYPRVSVSEGLNGIQNVFGAQVLWPNHEISIIQDLSYKGLATRRPGLFPIHVHQRFEIDLELGGDTAFRAPIRVAWCNADLIGCEFQALPPEGHLAMRDFLEAMLQGKSLKPVEKAFIGQHQSFQFWYQGIDGLDVSIWTNPQGEIEQVSLEGEDFHFDLRRGQRIPALTRPLRRALLILSQMDKDGLPMEEFLRTLF